MEGEVNVNSALLKDDDFGKRFESLNNTLNNSFMFSALILSIMIFWIGLIVNSLSDLELFKYYHALSGKNLIPKDFIFMMGLLHTCILLAFYIPVRLKFSTMKVTQPNALQGSVKSKPQIFIEQIATLLATLSPLIASMIQNIMPIVFN